MIAADRPLRPKTRDEKINGKVTANRQDPSAVAEIKQAQKDFLSFIHYTMPGYKANWHHEIIAHKLDQIIKGKINRLMIFVPPRYGKSQQVSRHFPAYLLGRNPDAQIISTSYSADLASRMNRDVQRIIESPRYRDLFPKTTLAGKSRKTISESTYLKNSEIFEIVDHTGSYRSAGVGGGITGMGFGRMINESGVVSGVGIIDDPFKNRQEADSITLRDSVWEWYTSTFRTRAEGDAAIIVCLTRWHEDDLAGRLLKLAQDDPDADQWDTVSFPAILENEKHPLDPREIGEALWHEKHDLKKLQNIKASIGSYDWSALYQQRPSPEAGSIFTRNDWQYYDLLPEHFEMKCISIDAAFKDKKDSDFVVIQVWGKVGARFYLIDQVRGKMPFTATVEAVKQMVLKHPKVLAKLIEDKANGTAIISSLKGKISGLIPVNPSDSKVARARAISPLIEAQNVYLPRKPWIGDFIEELTAFPNGSNDDQVDAMTQALYWMTGKNRGAVDMFLAGAI